MNNIRQKDIRGLYKPSNNSHKGENGRLLVVGGSKLFHASIFWAADVASKIVDLVHFSSPAEENNDLIRIKLKEGFWNGIVIPYASIDDYISEDDCILIGPGMPREDGLIDKEQTTKEVVNYLLDKYPNKRWVVDGGALQEVDTKLLNENMIITPHKREWEMLAGKLPESEKEVENKLLDFSNNHGGVIVLLKGIVDYVCDRERCVSVGGGNPGMTKGGTGDVLAGLVAALYCKNDAFLAATTASWVNKKSAERLSDEMGNYFNAGDLVSEVPKVLSKLNK